MPDIIAGICMPRCSPISTKDQWDMLRCVLLAKEIGAIPYRKGMACPLMDMPLKAVSAKLRIRRTLSKVERVRYGLYFPLNSAPYHFRFRI